ncbi:hypothetical protein [Saccharopolyspora gloriosae]|uniref:hypothetical protein n=1 Tax=Saccharopolyspora gloriosae TaxID=455344 RepID=UPI001FB649AA|nr:hypothetical protein [Saccharopolyspora gloriosae]
MEIAAERPALRGTDSATVRDLAAWPGLPLVRPDGCLATAARTADPQPLARWPHAPADRPAAR